MSSNRYNSPWAYDDSEVKCPKCGSEKIHRVLEQWCRIRGIQAFQCSSCGRRFYSRGHDCYRPTYER
jgi:predicted RNA-binding Zn-ribbon protein involved in translation (DUF1610 family)